ncbi:MAG: ABC transporter substrate-binding protein [Halanaerobiaceae bacterium]
MKQFNSRIILYIIVILLIIGGVFYTLNREEEESLTVGIIQIVEHPSLDAAREGFQEILAENGYEEGENITYNFKNAQGDMANANTIANQFANDKPDLVLAIATPTAQAAANSISDIPILITAVTDPVDAGLVDSIEKPNTNITGTSDLTPVKEQLNLLTEIAPDAEEIGTIYNAGESNSVVQAELTKEVCEELDLELNEATADNSGNVQQAAQSLAEDVDALYIFTDNTVVSSLETVIQEAEENDIPLIVGESDSVERGGLATRGLSYNELGRKTGQMALKIIEEDAEPGNMPIEYLEEEEMKLVINLKAAENMGVSISDELKDQADELIE